MEIKMHENERGHSKEQKADFIKLDKAMKLLLKVTSLLQATGNDIAFRTGKGQR